MIFIGCLPVYTGLIVMAKKILLSEKLAGLSSWWDVTWIIGGDFNVTCFPSKSSKDASLVL